MIEKQAMRGRQKQFSAWEDLSASERLKKLRTVLETSVRSGTRVRSRPFNADGEQSATSGEPAPDWSGGRSGGSKEAVDSAPTPSSRQTVKDAKKGSKAGAESSFSNIFQLSFEMP